MTSILSAECYASFCEVDAQEGDKATNYMTKILGNHAARG